jgi:hypothetical protein
VQREGYLLIDHRASPGLPPDIAYAMGMEPALVREGRVFEAATLTCCHCKSVVMKNPKRIRPRASCMKCGGKYICDGCGFEASLPDYNHLPFEKKRDQLAALVTKSERLGSPPELLLAMKG